MSTRQAFTELTSLTDLDLSQTGLSRLPDHFFAEMRKLRVLTLAGNKFTSVPYEINFARSLSILNLNDNPIRLITKDHFSSKMLCLRELHLSALRDLQRVEEYAFAELGNLTQLSLSGNRQLHYIDKNAFGELPHLKMSLQEIYLQDNQLSTLAEDLLPWSKIDRINIQNNPWRCDCEFKWVVDILIPDIVKTDPEHSLSIICAMPEEMQGRSAVELEGITLPCQPKSLGYKSSSGLIVATILVGAMLFITASIVFAYVLYRMNKGSGLLNRSIKYQRAYNDDDSRASTVYT